MSHRHRRRRSHRGFSSAVRHFTSERRRGWGFNLFRNTRDGKIGGVSAGLADYWDIETWVVRILWVGLFLFTGALAFWAYVGLWILMAPRPRRAAAARRRRAAQRSAQASAQSGDDVADEPAYEDAIYEGAGSEGADYEDTAYEAAEVEMEYDEHRHQYRPRKVFRYSDSTSVRLQRARDRLDGALRRVEDVESYVTSRRYELNKEFSKL